MRVRLRQINEKSQSIARVSDWLPSNLQRMTTWDKEFVDFVFCGNKKKGPRNAMKEYERAHQVLRSTKRLIREAIKGIIPEITHQEADDLADEIITKENIISKFDNVAVEFRRNSIF